MLRMAGTGTLLAANMADASSHNRTELSAACVAAEAATELDAPREGAYRAPSDPSFSVLHSMQDIIEHEYALVESIPDEDRAALMPIIRFVRNTLQDPFTTAHDLPQGCAMEALYMNERSGMLCNDQEGYHYKEMETRPHRYAFNGTEEMQCRNAHCMVDMVKESTPTPWQWVTSTEALRQHWSFQGPQNQKEVPTFGTACPFSKSINTLLGDYPAQPLCSHTYKCLHDSSSLESPKFRDHESVLSSILSGMDMESFHLEELRRSLRPSCDEMDSDVNDIDSVDVNNYSFNDYGDDCDDDGDNMDENDASLLAYQHYDKALYASDVARHSYWGNDLQYSPMPSTDNLLQFPKLHCRRRNVIKKVVGWVKKKTFQSFASRVRHKRRCNLPCCTDCEAGIKRRKVSGNGSKKCAKLSTIIKTSSPSPAINLEEKTNGYRLASNQTDGEKDFSASHESSHGKEASQVTRDWADSPLTTALIILLLDSSRRGMTVYEALQGLVQQGYSKIIGADSQQLAAHVKTTLKECPEFKELRNHRFILRDRRQLDSIKQSMVNAFHKQAAIGKPHFAQLPKRELSMSQEGCSQDLTKNLCASFSSRKLCQKPDQRELLQCRKTDGKHWRCIRNAKLGFLYCEHHQQSRGRNHSHSSHEKQHPCLYDERTNAANEEEMSETVVDSCSGQSVEQDIEEPEPIRCCRTDGRNWQCSNQAEEGSLYCDHHQGRCKKGMIKGHQHGTSMAENTKKLPKAVLIKQIDCIPSVSRFSMQLRPRRNNAAVASCVRDI